MKRIGIDFHVVDGIYQGSRTYVLELFSEVIRISPDIRFFLFLEKTEKLQSMAPAFALPNVEIIHMPRANPFKRLCWQLPLLQRKYRLDILHNQYILPIPSFSDGIVSIHDILFESYPQYFTALFKIRSAALIRLSAWRARHIFTISEFSKNEIMSRYGIRREKISIIYCGVDRARFFAGSAGRDIVESRGLASKGYLLSVGRLEPRKNHVTLLRAFAQMRATTLPLVLVGQPHFGFDDVYRVIGDLGLEGRVHIFSDVTDDELPAFYRHATLFVYPTWAEGFGMPLLEAMASGVPVISSDSTSVPEVVGDAAVLINPGDIDALAKAMDQLLSDQDIYRDLQARGLKQAMVFQWATAAETVRAVYLGAFA